MCRARSAWSPRNTTGAAVLDEVYPYPALIDLFGLERTLLYKACRTGILPFSGQSLKEREDLHDALVCAYTALHLLVLGRIRLPLLRRPQLGLHPRPGPPQSQWACTHDFGPV